MEEIYRDIIIENYKNPRNYGKIKNPDFRAREENIFCGDVVEIYLKLKNHKVSEIKFVGRGCVISQAAASILTESLKKKSIKVIEKFSLGDLIKLLGINLSPTRMKCAEVSLLALKRALKIIK